MKVYEDGAEKLTVYADVPGHSTSVINGYPSRAKSDIYEIWVRSAATDNVWVKCFANMTYNRALEMPTMPEYESAGSRHAYWKITAGWTHTYANIEMSAGSPVEVEIRKIGTTLLNGSSAIVKSAVHPAQKIVPDSKRDENGRVYFTITNPGQIVIDINGQMDDHNAAFPVGTPGGAMPGNPPVHTIALYANPIMVKPVASPTNTIVTVTPNQSSPTNPLYTAQPNPATYDTLVFAPGVHHIGPGFKVHPGKNYYIPGDAILYGNLSNEGVSQGSYRCTGDSINIYGYGTICGIVIPHYQSRTADDTANGTPNPQYPEYLGWPQPKDADVGIRIVQAWDTKITGVTVADPANFNTKFDVFAGRVNDQSLVSWVKLHSWRVNGDGCGGYVPIEDSLIRASDDNTYIRDWRRRCTFWKDSNANIFRFINYVAGGLEDCDVLYARFRFEGGAGNIFDFVGYSGSQSPVLTLKNIRFHDKLSNPRCIITLEPTTQAFINATFENVSFFTPLNNQLSEIIGGPSAPYTGRVMFKNVTFQNGLDGSSPVRLNQSNYSNYFTTSAYVDPSIFEPVALPTVTVSATDASAAEPGDNGTFTFTRSGSTAAALTVSFTVGGTATSGSDYASLGTSVTIAAGQASATKTVAVIDDTTAESSETVIVNLASGAGYTTGSPTSATVTIADNDVALPTVTVAATDASAGEPADSGTFTFTRSGSTSAALTVNFAVTGTATSGSDYTSLGTSVTIPAGQASATATVAVLNDTVVESTETVVVTLSNNSAYTIGAASSATVNVADDDVVLPTVTVAATTANAAEPSTNGAFTFTRTGSTSAALTVNFAVTGTATSGSDYTSLGTSVTIPAGQASATATVAVLSDTAVESTETVVVTLSNNAAYTIGASSSATVNIADAPSSGGLPWVVNFNGLATGTTSQGAPTSWTATRGGTFSVAADRLQINGAGGEGVFTTGLIDISSGSVNLSLEVQSGGGVDASDYIRLYTKVDGGAETLVSQVSGAQAATTWTKTGINGSTLQVIIRSSVTALDEFYYFDNLSITLSGPGALPNPWQTTDIGTVGATGSASYSGGTWTLAGSGADIGGTADKFRYVYQSASGDCSIIARVASLTNTNAWAMAGVMVRETTATNAQSILLCVTPSSGVSIQYRGLTGGGTTGVTVTGQTAPKWLKLTRTGNSFTAYRSDNGTTWTQVGSAISINMAASTTLGLAVTSHNTGTLCTTVMDNVTATP